MRNSGRKAKINLIISETYEKLYFGYEQKKKKISKYLNNLFADG